MFAENTRKKIIIVYDSETKVYAHKLSQLIACVDGKNNELNEMPVEACIWDEKKYNENEATVSSNQAVIYIGKKAGKDIIPNIKIKFDEFGVKYGWLGNKAVLYVEKRALSMSEYNALIRKTRSIGEEIKRINRNKIINNKTIEMIMIGMIGFTTLKVIDLVMRLDNNKKIMKQQYHFMAMEFYLNGLMKFLDNIR